MPYREFFIQQQQPMTIPDVYTAFGNELYIILVGWEGTGETASFKAYINPLINWLWFGGLVFILGTMLAAWPTKTRQPQSIRNPVLPKWVPAK